MIKDLGFEIVLHEGEPDEVVVHGHGCRTLEEAKRYVDIYPTSYGPTLRVTDQAICDELTAKWAPVIAAEKAAKARMKQWPKDKAETVGFEELTNPLRRAFNFMFKATRKNADKDVPYSGYDLGGAAAVAVNVPELLSANYLDFIKEDQGRDELDVFIQLCVQVGIEQGVRIERDKRRADDVILDAVRKKVIKLDD